MRDRIVNCQISAFEVDVQRLVPFLGLEFLNGGPDAVDAGIGEYNIQSSKSVECGVDRAFHFRRSRDIAGQKDRPAAQSFNVCDDGFPFALLPGDVNQADPRALLREPQRRALPYPARPAGHERHLAVQQSHRFHTLLPFSSESTRPLRLIFGTGELLHPRDIQRPCQYKIWRLSRWYFTEIPERVPKTPADWIYRTCPCLTDVIHSATAPFPRVNFFPPADNP